MLTVVHGRAGDVVPAHGYSKGCVTYVVTGRIQIDDAVLGAGDAGTYTAPGGYFSVKFLEDSTYLVARVVRRRDHRPRHRRARRAPPRRLSSLAA